MPIENNRQHYRAIMEVLMKDIALSSNSPEAFYSDGIRSMKSFLTDDGNNGTKMDVIQKMLSGSVGDGMRYPPEVQTILNDIDMKMQFNMRYFSYLSAQEMGLTDRPCDISRTGMSYPSAHNYKPGDYIIIRTLLPLDPPFISSFILDVAWCRETPDRASLPFRVGGSFRFRNEYEKIVIARLVNQFMD